MSLNTDPLTEITIQPCVNVDKFTIRSVQVIALSVYIAVRLKFSTDFYITATFSRRQWFYAHRFLPTLPID